MINFGSRMKDRREHLGLSRGELASKIDVSATSIYAWETKSNLPKRGSVNRLANALGVSTGYLLNGDDEDDGFEPLSVATVLDDAKSKIRVLMGLSEKSELRLEIIV